MRLVLIIAAIACSGCQSAEFAVNHQMTGLHVVAKFEAKDDGQHTAWNDGGGEELVRR